MEGCGDVADGTCIVLSKDSDASEGINKIVTADDGLLWAASGSSSISRWKLPRRVRGRTIEEGEIIVTDSLGTTIRKKRVSLGTESGWSPSPLQHQGRYFSDHSVVTYLWLEVVGMKCCCTRVSPRRHCSD